MNLANKITVGRMILAIIIILILVFPFHEVNYIWPKYLIAGKITIDFKYILCGILFTIASLTDYIDGNIARKNNTVTEFGKVMDAIADKVLVNGILIILAYDNFIPVLIPVIVITRDIAVDAIKMVVGRSGSAVGASFCGKAKTVFMMLGLILVFFYNLPLSLFNLAIGNYLVFIATILSVYSGIQYYAASKAYLAER